MRISLGIVYPIGLSPRLLFSASLRRKAWWGSRVQVLRPRRLIFHTSFSCVLKTYLQLLILHESSLLFILEASCIFSNRREADQPFNTAPSTEGCSCRRNCLAEKQHYFGATPEAGYCYDCVSIRTKKMWKSFLLRGVPRC